MIIEVRSRKQAKLFTHEKPWAAISICTYEDWPNLNDENRVGLLRLSFKDTNWPDQEGAMTDGQADKIVDFVDEILGEIDALLIHCEAGLSRSPATAAAIVALWGDGDTDYYFTHYLPNTLVYNKILKAAMRREKFKKKFLI